MVVGNIVGSNIANIGLILGVAAVVRPFGTDMKMHFRDGFLVLATAISFFVIALNNEISRFEGISMLLVYATYVGFLARSDQAETEYQFRHFIQFFMDLEVARPLARKIVRRGDKTKTQGLPRASIDIKGIVVDLSIALGSCASVAVGAHYMVEESIWLARLLSVPDSVIGLSIVAVGTSLPELVVAISAARKDEGALAVGNVMGSNIANLLFIGGLSSTIRPMDVAEISVVYTIPIMIFFSVGLVHFVKSDWMVTRAQGALVIASYIAFMVVAFVYGWG
jgi:cation:H+ antiporter